MNLTNREMMIAVAAFTAGMENAGGEDRDYAKIFNLVSQIAKSGYLNHLMERFEAFWEAQKEKP